MNLEATVPFQALGDRSSRLAVKHSRLERAGRGLHIAPGHLAADSVGQLPFL